VADAVFNHYKPRGQGDGIASAPISISVALADRFDSLAGFFAVGLKPTGSSDPYALRRLALGAIRTILDNRLRLHLHRLIGAAHSQLGVEHTPLSREKFRRKQEPAAPKYSTDGIVEPSLFEPPHKVIADVMSFLSDRLKVALREKGTRHDLIDAVFSLGNEDDLVRLVARVEALQAFLKTDDGANLLVAYRRAANILRDEEKRDKTSYNGEPDPELLSVPEEKALFVELATASELIRAEVERERFVQAMGVMARLRAPVDAFFDKVTVNDKNPELRGNRLKLLSRLRATLHLVADFSKIEG
jgi:glycyl-tRNA synthetase beta chain